MSQVNVKSILSELATFENELRKLNKPGMPLDDLMKVMISAKLGGENWQAIVSRIDENLGKTTSDLVQSIKGRVDLTRTPSIGLECLKIADWVTPAEEEEVPHPSTQDSNYSEFCEVLNAKTHDPKALSLFFTASTAEKNQHHTLYNAGMRSFLGQTVDSHKKTVSDVLEYSKEKKHEDDEAFIESYATLLSCLKFDKKLLVSYAHSHPDIECLKPPTEKIKKEVAMGVVNINVNELKKISSRVNPAKITLEDKTNFDSLINFIGHCHGHHRPSTADVTRFVEVSEDLLSKYRNSLYTPAEYHQFLATQYVKIANQMRSFRPAPDKLKQVGHQMLFSNISRLEPTISSEELEEQLQKLQEKLTIAENLKSKGFL